MTAKLEPLPELTRDITEKSDAFEKTNAQAMEFRVALKPDAERKLHYAVHCSW